MFISSLLILLSLFYSTHSVQLIQKKHEEQLKTYGYSGKDCEGRISSTVVSLQCGSSLVFGTWAKKTNGSELTGGHKNSINRHVLVEDTVINLRPMDFVDNGALVATHFEIKGGGEEPSFESRTRIQHFKKKVLDGDIFHALAENSHFLFNLVLFQKGDGNQDTEKPKTKRTSDPFDEEVRRRVLESSQTARALLVYLFDHHTLDIIRTAEVDFQKYPISKWQYMSITFLARVHENRLVFLAVFDNTKRYLLYTNLNSLTMSVLPTFATNDTLLQAETSSRIESLHSCRGYVFVQTEDTVIVYTVNKKAIDQAIADKDGKGIDEYLRLVQRIPLGKKIGSVQVKVFAKNDLIRLVFHTSTDIQVWESLYNEKDRSIFFLSIEDKLPRRIIGIGGTATNIETLTQSEAGEFSAITIPICPPNERLMPDLVPAMCSHLIDKSDKYILGGQSNEARDCREISTTLSVEIPRSFICTDFQKMRKYLLAPNETYIPNLDNYESPSSLKQFNCAPHSDCYNCSMMALCRWDNIVHKCQPIKFKYEPDKSYNYLKGEALETGTLTLDLASLKIHKDCPRREDLKIDTYQGKDYWNLSIVTPPNSNELTLVVSID